MPDVRFVFVSGIKLSVTSSAFAKWDVSDGMVVGVIRDFSR